VSLLGLVYLSTFYADKEGIKKVKEWRREGKKIRTLRQADGKQRSVQKISGVTRPNIYEKTTKRREGNREKREKMVFSIGSVRGGDKESAVRLVK